MNAALSLGDNLLRAFHWPDALITAAAVVLFGAHFALPSILSHLLSPWLIASILAGWIFARVALDRIEHS